nr:MAG TPA_asm: hypothetical protein [Caudoviricetes sp.]
MYKLFIIYIDICEGLNIKGTFPGITLSTMLKLNLLP